MVPTIRVLTSLNVSRSSLGEVIKFRVYNARINQQGGDRADQYFHQTESIAGIRDARFQTMMPDVLNWLGLRRIDWLCSMSNEKYSVILPAGCLRFGEGTLATCPFQAVT